MSLGFYRFIYYACLYLMGMTRTTGKYLTRKPAILVVIFKIIWFLICFKICIVFCGIIICVSFAQF